MANCTRIGKESAVLARIQAGKPTLVPVTTFRKLDPCEDPNSLYLVNCGKSGPLSCKFSGEMVGRLGNKCNRTRVGSLAIENGQQGHVYCSIDPTCTEQVAKYNKRLAAYQEHINSRES